MAQRKNFTWIYLAVHFIFVLTSPPYQSKTVPQQQDMGPTGYKGLEVQPAVTHSDRPSSPIAESWKGTDPQNLGHVIRTPRNLTNVLQQDITSGPCRIYLSPAHDTVVNCSSMNLATLEPTWFPANTTELLLDYNLLRLVPNLTFSHLAQLSLLSLNHNRISRIQENAFQGLEGLKSLEILNNRLEFNETSYPPGIFKPLKNLRKLDLRINRPSKAYPEHLFYGLTSLEFLLLDTAGDELHFGEEFTCLTNLSRLMLTGEVKTITNTSFINLKYLKYLYIRDSILMTNFSHSALKPLRYLEEFALNRIYLGVSEVLHILKPLAFRNTTIKMKSIYFRDIVLSQREAATDLDKGNAVLDSSKTEYLRNICVEKLTLIGCNIMVVKAGAAISDVWKSCLKVLDMSGNPLIGTFVAFYQILSSLPNLNTFVATRSRHIARNNFIDETERLLWLEEVRRQGGLAQRNHQTLPLYENVITGHVSNEREKSPRSPHDTDDFDLWEANKECTGYIFRTSDSLRVLQLSGLFLGGIMNKNICLHAQSLRVMNISFGGFRLFTGVIRVWASLQTVDVSGNDLSVLSVNFVDSLTGLMDLRVANCRLDPNLMFLHGARIFRKLHALQRLDLAFNSLSLLEHGIFSTNTNLSHLTLSGNKFKEIPFALTDTPRLQVLDLRGNIITTLNPDITEQLDNLAKQNGKFTLLFSGNILSCACDNLLFLHWLRNTHIVLDNDGNYTCIDEEGKLSYTAAYRDSLSLWRKCIGKVALSDSLILLFIIIIGFLVFFVIWKNKTFVISVIMHQFIPLKQRHDYDCDVFIGYAEGDYPFVRHELNQYIEETLQLQTYLHQRDMLQGFFTTNILDAISNSWRIILVVTDSFLQDDLSSIICSSAISSVDWTNPLRVVVLVEQRLCHRLPRDLVRAVHEDNVVVMAAMQLEYETKEALRTRLVTG